MKPRSGRLGTLGPGLLLVGLAAVFLSARIDHPGLGNNHDPGPTAFPWLLGIGLVVLGIWEIVERAAKHFLDRSSDGSRAALKTGTSQPEPLSWAQEHRTLIVILASLIIYIMAIPWLGFSLATLVFASITMTKLGVSWKWSLLSSVILVVAIHLLFTTGFKVQFPTGIIDWPW